jgi:hypothetical protein
VIALLWFMLAGGTGTGTGVPTTLHLESGAELARAVGALVLPHA